MRASGPDYEFVQLVVVGSFNPGVLQPSWLARHELIRESEADSAELQVISTDICAYSTDWFTFEVLPERLQLRTSLLPYSPALRDLGAGLFAFLESVKVTAVGINHTGHYKFDNEEQWNRFGHELAPKTFWQPFTRDPGTRKITVKSDRPDSWHGEINYTIEPSLVPTLHPGVFLNMNDHYVVEPSADDIAQIVARLIIDNWGPCTERFERFAQEVKSFAESLRNAK